MATTYCGHDIERDTRYPSTKTSSGVPNHTTLQNEECVYAILIVF